MKRRSRAGGEGGVDRESERQQGQSTGRCGRWQMEKKEKNVFNVERNFRSAKAK